MSRLTGKVAIITGAAQGMGAAHAKAFVEQGAKVVLTDLNEEKGKAFAAELGENAIFVKQNVTSEEDWTTVIAKAEEAFGPVNVLVNNAGISMNKNMLEMSLDEYMKIVNINQVSVFLGMKAVAASMMKAGGGSIVNISSISSYAVSTNRADYCVAKSAMPMMTALFATCLAGENIRVHEVCPGVVASDMTAPVKEKYDALIASGLSPIRRWGTPEDVARAVAVLVSDAFPFSTGERINIDGGFHIRRL